MIPRFGEPVLKDQRYRHRPGAYAVLVRGDDILVTFEAGSKPEFQLPGGGIDPGEGPVSALHREVMEETGWRISEVRRLGAYRRFVYMPDYDLWAEKLCHMYIARPVLRISAPTEEHHTAIWMPIEAAARAVASPGDRAVLRSLL